MDILDDYNRQPDLAPAGLRFKAAFIDFILFWLISLGIGSIFGKFELSQTGFNMELTGFPALLAMLAWIPLVPLSEGMTGQTPGKRLCKIKVVKRDYTDTNIPTSFVRHLFDIIDYSFFFIGLFMIAFSKKKQRIGDLVAGTSVVMKS